MPRRSAGRMRQWNEVEGGAFAAYREGAAYNFIEFLERNKLRDRQFADGDDKPWSQQIDLVVHPRRAISNFIGRGNPISAGLRFARETTADGGEVDLRPHLGFGQLTKFLKPTEQRPASRPRERFPENWLFHAGRLADQHYLAENGSA